jgi:hypothetical protein
VAQRRPRHHDRQPKYKGTNEAARPEDHQHRHGAQRAVRRVSGKEIDFVEGPNLSPADNDIVAADPDLSKQLHPHYGDFRTDYLFFDTRIRPSTT